MIDLIAMIDLIDSANTAWDVECEKEIADMNVLNLPDKLPRFRATVFRSEKTTKVVASIYRTRKVVMHEAKLMVAQKLRK
jgi:hypothetical protein